MFLTTTVSSEVCAWCLGDLKPVQGAPSLYVCVYCGRAVSFLHGPAEAAGLPPDHVRPDLEAVTVSRDADLRPEIIPQVAAA